MNYDILDSESGGLSLYYFAYRKAKRFQQEAFGFYDPVEICDFENKLEENLLSIQTALASGEYKTESAPVFLVPKSPGENKESRFRPIAKIAFKDQVAWATVVLALGEWFDTNQTMLEYMPGTFPNNYDWMVDWSCNNRLRRKYYFDETTGIYQRLHINLWNTDLYESYQWSLRNLRTQRQQQFANIRKKGKSAYYGIADIKEFYPSLKMVDIEKQLEQRLSSLGENGFPKNMSIWKSILESLCDIKLDLSYLGKQEVKYLTENKLDQKLVGSLPIGLISAGFLANCALTERFDHKMEKFCYENKGEIYITRYTDDIMVVSSQDELVKASINKIEELLDKLGLNLAMEKVTPKPNSYFQIETYYKNYTRQSNKKEIERLEIYDDELRNEILSILPRFERKNNKSHRVSPYDNIPGSTSIIDQLSQIGDQSVRAMDNDELLKYIESVVLLLRTEFAPEEIKAETKATFAAWRVRKGDKELMDRKLTIRKLDTMKAIKNAVLKFPYKLSLIDCYLIYLLEQEEQDTNICKRELQEFLSSCSKTNNEQTGLLPGDYGTFLRTRVLYTIANNWGLTKIEHRKALRTIISKEINKWYTTDVPSWHEQMGISWLWAVMDMNQRPLLNHNGKVPECVGRMHKLWMLSQQSADTLNPALVATMQRVFYLRKLPNADYSGWLNWLIEQLEIDCINLTQYDRCLNGLIKMGDSGLPPHFMDALLTRKGFSHQTPIGLAGELAINSGIVEFIDKLIIEWIREPSGIKAQEFIKSLEKYSSESENLAGYAIRRIKNIAYILQIICNNNLSLHSLGVTCSNTDEQISLLDWITLIEANKSGFNNTILLRPLCEIEILRLARAIIKQIQKEGNNLDYLEPNSILISREEWNKFRNTDYEPRVELKQQAHPHEWYYSPFLYLNIPDNDSDYKICYSVSMILWRLLAGRDFFNRSLGVLRLSGWKGLGDIVQMAGYCSTGTAELIAGALNYQKILYEHFYKSWNLRFPYIQLDVVPITNLSDYEDKLNELCERSFNSFLSNAQGIELRYINVDLLTGGAS